MGAMLNTALILGEDHPWKPVYAPDRKPLAAARNFLRENMIKPLSGTLPDDFHATRVLNIPLDQTRMVGRMASHCPSSSASIARRSRKALVHLRRKWSEREDLNLRPLVSQTSALTGLRHAPNAVPLARIAALRKARSHHFGVAI